MRPRGAPAHPGHPGAGARDLPGRQHVAPGAAGAVPGGADEPRNLPDSRACFPGRPGADGEPSRNVPDSSRGAGVHPGCTPGATPSHPPPRMVC